MKSIRTKLTVMIIAVAVAFSFMPMANEASAASKPAKVKGVKVTGVTASTVTLKWKKAKGAKKYQIFTKEGKRKFRAVKAVKKRKAVIKKLRQGKTYSFKIRGIKGSKRGRFSKAVTVKTDGKEKGISDKKENKKLMDKGEVIGPHKGIPKERTLGSFNITSLTVKDNTITVKWSKPKNSTGPKKFCDYLVYLKYEGQYFERQRYKEPNDEGYNKNGWKQLTSRYQISNYEKREFSFPAPKTAVYYVKVKAINGRSVSFTPAKSIRVNVPVVKVSGHRDIKKPGTYQLKNHITGKTQTVQIEIIYDSNDVLEKRKWVNHIIKGSMNGKYYDLSDNMYGYNIFPEDLSYRVTAIQGKGLMGSVAAESNAKDITLKWTCDGTDPEYVTKDKWGSCEYTKSKVPIYPYAKPKVSGSAEEQAERMRMWEEACKEWDKKYKHGDEYYEYLETYLHGITKPMQKRVVFDENDDMYYTKIFWVNAYRSGKLIAEYYFKTY